MKVKLENVRIEKIDNGYLVEISFNRIKEDESKEWDTLMRFCETLEDLLEYVKETLVTYNK